jgi:hypothetical protein
MYSFRKTIFLVVVFILTIKCHFNNEGLDQQLSDDYQKWNLQGNVKTITEELFSLSGRSTNIIKFNEAGKITSQASFNNDMSLIKRHEFQYSNENLSSQKCFVTGDTLSYTTIYNYSENKKLISTQIIEENGRIGIRSAFEYDTLGNKIEETYYNIDKSVEKKIKHTYDHKNRLIYSIIFDNLKNKKWIEKIRYNEKGQKSQLSILSYTPQALVQDIKYEYNKNDKLSKKTIHTSHSSRPEIHHYCYDTFGNTINIITNSGESPNQLNHQTTEYTYDNKGNWLRAVTVKDNERDMIIERKIEYYD